MRLIPAFVILLTPLCGCSLDVTVSDSDPVALSHAADWHEAERGILENHVQLTFGDRFVKAGEAYFSPDDSRIVFQAVERREGAEPDAFYAMFVADLQRDDRGAVTGLESIRRLSPTGSANTCGWFHPTDPNVVLFGSTIGPPTEGGRPGYQRDTSRYAWMFPPEMKIVQCDLRESDGTAATLEVMYGDDDDYQAECSLSRDGRHLLFCSVESNLGDLFVKDITTGESTRIVSAEGYDGGPFFAPDGRRICYRSDRRLNDYLQLFVADLAYGDSGQIVGIEREYQLTDNAAVNWCPFWHPGGRHLVYASSEVGHHNYEIFAVDADPGDRSGSAGTIRYGTRRRRVTHASGADVLPAFNSDGTIMMWTSKRGGTDSSQLWIADFVMDLDASPAPSKPRRP